MARHGRTALGKRTLFGSAAAIALSLATVGGVLGVNLLSREVRLDETTQCLLDAPLDRHTLMLVDATDPFTPDQAQRLRAAVAEERSALAAHAKFTLLLISPKTPFVPETVLSLCNPGSGAHANPAIANPAMIDRVWHQRFGAPIDAAVARLLTLPPGQRSPILESIAAASWRHDFDASVPQRRLRVVSDLLQHEAGGYSHYQGGDPWARFVRSALAGQVAADLTGVAVRIDYLRRPDVPTQNDTHLAFWKRWLSERGAASVDTSGRRP